MTVPIKHAKTNAIANWTQPELDTIIAGGPAPLPPLGTTLSQVVLPTDWNDDHVIDTTGASDGDVLTVVAGAAEWAPPSGGGGSPAGSNTQIQYNNAGAFGASSNLIFDSTPAKLSILAPTDPSNGVFVENGGATFGTISDNMQVTSAGFQFIQSGSYGGELSFDGWMNFNSIDTIAFNASEALTFSAGADNISFATNQSITFDGQSIFQAPAASTTTPTATFRAVTGQTANLTEWVNNVGTVLASITSGGAVTITSGQSIASRGTNPAILRLTSGFGAGNNFTFIGHNVVTPCFSIHMEPSGIWHSRHRSGGVFSWSSTGDAIGAADTGLGRNAAGIVEINNGTAGAWRSLRVGAATASTVAQIVRGEASQTANLQEWQNSAGTVLAQIGSTGNATFANITGNPSVTITNAGNTGATAALVVGTALVGLHVSGVNYDVRIIASGAARIPFTVRGAASHTANLQEWQNSAGTVLSRVAANGNISVPDQAYGAGWDGSLEVPTKNAIYDKIETMGGGVTESFVIAMAVAL